MPLSPEEKRLQSERNKAYREKEKADPVKAERRRQKARENLQRRLQDPVYAEWYKKSTNEAAKRHRLKNPEKARAATKKWLEGHPEYKTKRRETERIKFLDPSVAEEKKRRDKIRRQKEKDAMAKLKAENREEWDRVQAALREARRLKRNLSPEARAARAEWNRKRYHLRKKEPKFLFLRAARDRFRYMKDTLKSRGVPKIHRSRFADYYGCEPEVFVSHIESQFQDGMSWENHGEVWHIDHIVPISLGREDITLSLKLNNYKNLRPLPAEDNLIKSDSLPDFWPEGVPFTREELGLHDSQVRGS